MVGRDNPPLESRPVNAKRINAMVDAHNALTNAICNAIKTAVAAGLDTSDITAVLARFTELLESEQE